jgi:hypothetical protein
LTFFVNVVFAREFARTSVRLGVETEDILEPGPKMLGPVERWVEMTYNKETVQ